MSALLLCAVVFGAVRAHADVAQAIPEVSYLERWAVFSLGSGNGFSLISGGFHVAGDFGQAGNGKILMAGSALIDAGLYDRSKPAVLQLGNAMVTASTFRDQDAVLDESVNQALAASDRAFSLVPNRSNASANLEGNENLTITLQRTATTNFIINVRRRFS